MKILTTEYAPIILNDRKIIAMHDRRSLYFSARRSCQAEKIIVEILSVVVLVESADIACSIQVRNMLFLMLRKMFHTLRRIPAQCLKPCAVSNGTYWKNKDAT